MIDLNSIASQLGFELEDIQMLVEMFIDSSKQSLQEMESALTNNDLKQLSAHAHSIKGSAANLTLEEISDIALSIEESANNQSDFNYKEAVSKLKNLIEDLSLVSA